MTLTGEVDRRRPRSPLTFFSLGGIAILLIVGLTALGVWQLQRRVWKLDMIARTEQRVNAVPQDLPGPGPGAWPIDASRDAYRHVRASGVWLTDNDTFVKAVTALGPGYWVMTPLRTDAGFTVLINRGFVSADSQNTQNIAIDRPTGRAEITGLLRISEPGGGFLRSNDPAADRWFSRDVAAIARARGIHDNAPYFLDADRMPGATSPMGGMTVVAFANNHLVYAVTWFALAAMVLGAAIYLVLDQRRPATEAL